MIGAWAGTNWKCGWVGCCCCRLHLQAYIMSWNVLLVWIRLHMDLSWVLGTLSFGFSGMS